MVKIEKYLKHLYFEKEQIKKTIQKILDNQDVAKFTSQNLQYLINDLKEIETKENFIKSKDFEMLIKFIE